MLSWHDRWGIKHLSPSSLNSWRDNPAAFVANYCFGFRSEEAAPAMWRGSACEGALSLYLYSRDATAAAQKAVDLYELEAKGLADDDTEKQRQLVPQIAQCVIAAADCESLPKPIATQLRVEHRLDGFEVPIIGYPDFIFDGYCLDLKTTEKVPSKKPNAMHAMQASFYAAARGERYAKLLYVSHTKHNLFVLDEMDIAENVRDLTRLAKSIRAVLSKALTKEELAEMCAPDFSHYRWSDEKLVSRVKSEIREWS